MDRATFDGIQVVDTVAAALALSETTKGGAPTKFLFADTTVQGVLVSGVNSQQNQVVGAPDINRVSFFERLPQEKCCATYGTMTTRHSASFGLDMVYPGPYPGKGHAGFAIKSLILAD